MKVLGALAVEPSSTGSGLGLGSFFLHKIFFSRGDDNFSFIPSIFADSDAAIEGSPSVPGDETLVPVGEMGSAIAPGETKASSVTPMEESVLIMSDGSGCAAALSSFLDRHFGRASLLACDNSLLTTCASAAGVLIPRVQAQN